MDPEVIVKVAMGLILQERAQQKQIEYSYSKAYSRERLLSPRAHEMRKQAEVLLRGREVEGQRQMRDLKDLEAYVRQSFGFRRP